MGWYLMVPPTVLLPTGNHDVNGKPVHRIWLAWLNLADSKALAHWETVASYDTAAECQAALASLDVERTAQLKIDRADQEHPLQLEHYRSEFIAALKTAERENTRRMLGSTRSQ